MKWLIACALFCTPSVFLMSCGSSAPEVSVPAPEPDGADAPKPGRGAVLPEPPLRMEIPADALGRLDMAALEDDAYSEFWRYFNDHPEFGVDPDQVTISAPRELVIPYAVRTLYFERRYNGIPVLLRDDERLSLTFDPETGIVSAMSNTWLPIRRSAPPAPRIQSGTATDIALEPSMMTQSQFEDVRLVYQRGPDGRLELVWQVSYYSPADRAGVEVLVDAVNGEVLGVRRWEE